MCVSIGLNPMASCGLPTATITTDFQYDGNGNLILRQDGNGDVTTFEYDALDRATSIEYPGGTSPDVTFTYDPNGNRTRLTETISPTTTVTEYAYDSDSRLLCTTLNGVQDERFYYDALGNLIQRVGVGPDNTTQIEYVYDFENRLVRFYDGTNNVEYVYNGVGEPWPRSSTASARTSSTTRIASSSRP